MHTTYIIICASSAEECQQLRLFVYCLLFWKKNPKRIEIENFSVAVWLAGWLGSRVKTIAETGQKKTERNEYLRYIIKKKKEVLVYTHAVVTADADIHTHTRMPVLFVCVCYGCFYCSCPNWNNELDRRVYDSSSGFWRMENKATRIVLQGERSARVLYKTITLKF